MKGQTVLAYVSSNGPETLYRLESSTGVVPGSFTERSDAVRVFPNQVDMLATLVITKRHPGLIRFVVTDSRGQQVYKGEWKYAGVGSSQHKLDVSDLPTGTYWVRTIDANGRQLPTALFVVR
jgi:hypothetical protein